MKIVFRNMFTWDGSSRPLQPRECSGPERGRESL